VAAAAVAAAVEAVEAGHRRLLAEAVAGRDGLIRRLETDNAALRAASSAASAHLARATRCPCCQCCGGGGEAAAAARPEAAEGCPGLAPRILLQRPTASAGRPAPAGLGPMASHGESPQHRHHGSVAVSPTAGTETPLVLAVGVMGTPHPLSSDVTAVVDRSPAVSGPATPDWDEAPPQAGLRQSARPEGGSRPGGRERLEGEDTGRLASYGVTTGGSKRSFKLYNRGKKSPIFARLVTRVSFIEIKLAFEFPSYGI
jgi:hypothetical protein